MSKGYTATVVRPVLTEEEKQRRINTAKEAVARFAIATGMGKENTHGSDKER